MVLDPAFLFLIQTGLIIDQTRFISLAVDQFNHETKSLYYTRNY